MKNICMFIMVQLGNQNSAALQKSFSIFIVEAINLIKLNAVI